MGLHVWPSIAPILYIIITPPGPMSHLAKTWVPLLTTTYKSKSTKYFHILLLPTCEEVLHAPTVQVWAQYSTILPPNNLLIVCHSSFTNWSQNTLSELKLNMPAKLPDMGKIYLQFWKSVL